MNRRPRRTTPKGELPRELDLVAAGQIGGLARDFLAGENLDLLSPLRFLAPGKLPTGKPPRVDRAELARGLAIANLSYGHPRSSELAAKLADPATQVVVTGQQTGLFGGPLLALVKAAAAVRWAEELERRGKPALALFWMATEDHDWAEVAQASFPAADGVRRYPLGDDPQPLTPVGLRTIGVGVRGILQELALQFPNPAYHAWLDRLGAIWRPEARFGEAFARQLVLTLGERSPLLLDSMLPALKRAEAPYLRRLVERRYELDAAFSVAEERIRSRGRDLQVAPQPGASPLFLLRAFERRRIEWRGGERFALRGGPPEMADEPVADLLTTLDENPAVVSPGVLARPGIQDAVLGTTLQILGPGEMAYFAQAATVYPLLDIAAPWIALRPQAAVLPAKQARRLAEMGIGAAELLADPASAERRLGERSGGDFVAARRAAVAKLLDELREPALAIDPSLEKPYGKTRESTLRALDLFADKVAAAAARRDETARQRFAALVRLLRPEEKPQERVISAAHFPGEYGDGFGAALLDGLTLDPRRLSLIDPAPRAEGEGA
jgi:bacillithiol biosynthesis cysteine-adding enzyme BshC